MKKTNSQNKVNSLNGSDLFKIWMAMNNITQEELERQIKNNKGTKEKIEEFKKLLEK